MNMYAAITQDAAAIGTSIESAIEPYVTQGISTVTTVLGWGLLIFGLFWLVRLALKALRRTGK